MLNRGAALLELTLTTKRLLKMSLHLVYLRKMIRTSETLISILEVKTSINVTLCRRSVVVTPILASMKRLLKKPLPLACLRKTTSPSETLYILRKRSRVSAIPS